MDVLWLGYDGLSVPYAHVVAIVFYHPALNGRIARAYGRVPDNIGAVVVTNDGDFLPARWKAEQLRQWLARWRAGEQPQPESI